MSPHTESTFAPSSHRAWVIFTHKTEILWLRALLKSGFRHCFIIIHDGRHWLSIDPMAHMMDVAVQDVPDSVDLIAWFRAQDGFTVVDAPFHPAAMRPAPMMLFTCVEVCKRVLGLRARWVVTPWQLYRHLTQR